MFQTCSYSEFGELFRSDLSAGVPVQTSNGFPRFLKASYKGLLIAKPELKLPLVYPASHTLKWAPSQFVPAYKTKLDEAGVDAIRAAAAKIREAAEVDESTPLVLLCFEQLAKKPGTYCHRSLFARWWTEQTGDEVPELGGVAQAEIRAQEELF